MGAKLELCALLMLVGGEAPLEWMRHATRVAVADTAARVKRVGARHFVLGTDLGQTGNPTPADGLQMFVAALEAAGISRQEIQTMGREVPGALLMG
jgi:microsomal dipeptidase-like Zn-dependent dipeptidase